jgi:hypothetical protein
MLVEKGASLLHEDENQLNCLDVCILQINYKPALFIFQNYNIQPKSAEFYRARAVSKHCDYELFIQYLESGRLEI